MFGVLRETMLYVELLKCEFWMKEVFGHVVLNE